MVVNLNFDAVWNNYTLPIGSNKRTLAHTPIGNRYIQESPKWQA